MQNPVVNVMVKAARAAGNVLLRNMSRLESLNVVEKARQDYASEVDGLAEREIIRELKRAYPDYAILGEETGQTGKGRYTFIVDPLDGTSNYLRGIPHFCVSIALVDNGEPTDAVIYDPIRNELFCASRGAGAVLNDRRIRINTQREIGG
ncbi:MAG: inositol monophosphatase family protein, partial [Silanimonas sp.]